MVTYAVIVLFVLVALALVFGYDRLRRLQGQMRKARTAAERSPSEERGAAYALAREKYNNTVATFPTSVVAVITGFVRED